MIQEILQREKFAKENGLQLSGHVLGVVKRALTGKEEIVIDQVNVISDDLKINMRNTMNTNVDFALDNLQATQVAQAALSASLNAKDGLFLFDNSGGETIDDGLAFMASAVHPTDPAGAAPYYRQWQGVYQNLTGVTELSTEVHIGHSYTHGTGIEPFGSSSFGLYAEAVYATVTLLNNDIITINWKITVG